MPLLPAVQSAAVGIGVAVCARANAGARVTDNTRLNPMRARIVPRTRKATSRDVDGLHRLRSRTDTVAVVGRLRFAVRPRPGAASAAPPDRYRGTTAMASISTRNSGFASAETKAIVMTGGLAR